MPVLFTVHAIEAVKKSVVAYEKQFAGRDEGLPMNRMPGREVPNELAVAQTDSIKHPSGRADVCNAIASGYWSINGASKLRSPFRAGSAGEFRDRHLSGKFRGPLQLDGHAHFRRPVDLSVS